MLLFSLIDLSFGISTIIIKKRIINDEKKKITYSVGARLQSG
jgi:hypothetical protein